MRCTGTCESLECSGYPGGGIDLDKDVVAGSNVHLQQTRSKEEQDSRILTGLNGSAI